jgi:hypothetical protein
MVLRNLIIKKLCLGVIYMLFYKFTYLILNRKVNLYDLLIILLIVFLMLSLLDIILFRLLNFPIKIY